MLPIILNPVNHNCGQYKSNTENLSKLSEPLQQVLKSSYNDSQLEAISLSIGPVDLKKDFDLTLIQGPPGVLFFCYSIWLPILIFVLLPVSMFLDIYYLHLAFIFCMIAFCARNWEDQNNRGHC